MKTIYDHIPHVEFHGARIYHPEIKLDALKSKDSWTVSQVQRNFKIGYNAAIHLIEYAQSQNVLDLKDQSRHVTKWKVIKDD